MSKLFDELPTSMQGSDFGKEIKFSCNVHDIICDKVIGDALRLKQVYTNILSNAIKYTPNGGSVDFEVYQQEIEDSDKIRTIVKVSDTGIGMSEEFMEKMFVKFERETDTRLNSVSGYGLGLAIVKQIVELMDGTIDVQSKQGEGTTFTVAVDFQRAGFDGKVKHKKDYKELCRGMRLLVAEDNELSREVMEELLSMNGISCDVVTNGIECIEKFKDSDSGMYDAILMDVQMPKMNGIDAAKHIRMMDKADAKRVPIVAMTANALSSDVQSCLDAGMNKHLAKPIDVNKLLRALAKLKD